MLTLVAALSLCASAAASTWSLVQINAGTTFAHLYGMGCPTANLCVAVGGNGTVATSTRPTGDASAWRVIRPAGDGHEEEFSPGSSFGGAQLKDVDCPGAGLCVAASFDGRIYSSADPAGGSAAWKAIDVTPPKTPRVHMLGISCPSPALCVAAAYGGKIAFSTNPTGEAGDWHVLQLAEPYDFRGISCPAVSLCVAVDLAGRIVTSTDPTAGPGAWVSAGAPAGDERLTAVDCPSTTLCVTGNSDQILTATNPAGGSGAWKIVAAGTGIPITGISCPSVSACAAVDQNADVLISTDPGGGAGAWSFKNVVPYSDPSQSGDLDGNGMFGLSCASTALCAAAGSRYQVIASSNPFEPDEPKRAAGDGKAPRVLITAHPAKRVNPRKGGVKVTFRFRAIGKATGFRCKTSGRRYRRCKSPLGYRVGGGRQTFKVKAVGAGGLKGPPSSFHFRVGRISESPPAGSCPQLPLTARGRGCVNGAA